LKQLVVIETEAIDVERINTLSASASAAALKDREQHYHQ